MRDFINYGTSVDIKILIIVVVVIVIWKSIKWIKK
jgi:hypothetical protein